MAPQKQIFGFDLLKFVMAFFIVAIHTNFADAVSISNYYAGKALLVLQELGVPVFFAISSMLFFRKCGQATCYSENSRCYLHFIKRLTLVYGVYFVLLLPLIIRNKGYLTMDFLTFLSEFAKDLFLRYTFSGSWFLSALVMATTIVYLLSKKVTPWLILVAFFIFHLYLHNAEKLPKGYQSLIIWYELNIRDIHLSFPNALVWVSLGACTVNLKMLERVSKPQWLYYVGWSLFLAFFLMEYFDFGINGLGTFLMVVCLITLFYIMKLKPSVAFKRLREYSVLMFFWHFIVIVVFGFVFKRIFSATPFDILGMYFFPVILIIVITISTVILWAEKKRGFSWLCYFH